MPDRESIRYTLIELLEADTGEKYANLDDRTNLREGLGLDSVDVVSVVSQIERQYRIRLTHQELETLVNVGDVLNLLQVKLAAITESSAASPGNGAERRARSAERRPLRSSLCARRQLRRLPRQFLGAG